MIIEIFLKFVLGFGFIFTMVLIAIAIDIFFYEG